MRLSEAVRERLASADWPGNVRELENVVARLVALSSGGEIGPAAMDAAPAVDDAEAAVALDPRPEHRALIRQAGGEGIVLLKNDGALPLDKHARPFADQWREISASLRSQ